MSDTAHTAPRNTALRALFDELMELDDAQRVQRLASLSSGAREALAPLLHHAHKPVALLSVPAAEVLHSWREDDVLSERLLGQHIGSFEVLSLLGQGGSSVVLRAQRAAGSAMQVVALKVLRTGVFTAEARWRFAREQAILTQLDHPNIARLIEGGISADGLPYFAMELVDGEPITTYADRHALSLPARIALVATLCRAVEAAHSTMIVHRDLKPSNVLVTREGVVKVLDFGIAKSLDDSAPQHITLAIMLTPEYAAPEQFRPGPITTAADVYALGVLLGELLTGRLLGAAPTLRASSVVSTHRASLRGLPDSATLARMLRGDLDAIIATAMAEESARRYRSAGAMADDLDRYVSSRPVQAHPPSRWYRARKFMRRHRGGVAITALLALGMVASLAVALWQARAAQLAAAEARSEAARAHTLRNFMIEAFAQAAPSTPGAMDATVVDVVERAVMNARADQSANPSARVDLLIRLALVLDARDRAARSAELLAQAQALAQQALSPNDALHDELDLAMARNAILRYDFDVADARIHALRSRMPDHASPTHVLALIESATLATYRGRMQQAQTDAASAAAMARALNDDALLHDALRAQGSALIHAGDVTASIAAFEEALRLQRTRYADAHVDVATDQDALASAYQRAGDLVRAESYARAAVETDTRAMPGDHIHLAYHSVTLASIQIERRAFDQALPVLTRVIAIQTRQGARQSNLASNYESLSIARGGLGDWPGALAAVHHALSLLTDENDPSKRNRARIQSLYGWALAQNGERAAGLAQLDLALRMQRALPKPAPEQVAIALERVLRIALDHDDLTRAAQVLPQYLDAARALSGKPNWPGRAEAARVEYLLARGDTGGAQAALARASQQQQRSTRVDAEIRALIPILRLIAARRSALNEAVVSDLADAARRALAELPYPPQRLIRLAAAAGLAP